MRFKIDLKQINCKIEKDLIKLVFILEIARMDLEYDDQNSQSNQYVIDEEGNLPDAEDAASLIHEAKNFKILQDQLKLQPFLSRPFYYILSTKWLRRWKTYVSYDSCISAAPPNKHLGRGSLPKINQDILQIDSKITACFGEPYEYLNIKLKKGLQEEKDFIFLSEQMWAIFKKYDHTEVKRFVQQFGDGKKIELYFQQVNLVPVYKEFLTDVERQKVNKVMHLKFQVPHYISINNFQNLVKNKLKDYVTASSWVDFPSDLQVRMWLLTEDTEPNILANMLFTGCKANPTFNYKLFTNGEFMNPQKMVCDYDILPTSLILVQMRETKQNWIFWNQKKPFVGECGNCKSFQQLRYVCSCKFALYCSKNCKSQDKGHHKFRCPNDCESDQQQVQMKFNDHSRYGLTGLRNLGNTCFMNSGLQCLSHVMQLTNYFLSDKYLNQINKQNKLGTRGQLSTAYAKLLKQLWMGSDNSVSPTQLKRAIEKFQKMFVGYSQHDSGQLVSYLLDGIHEDLNRIKQKPYTQANDYDGRQDFLVARQSWQYYLQRNSSIIVDLMFGQFKSIVDCPQCQFQSIQFDPFLMCTLPIVNDNLKKLEVNFLRNHFDMTTMTICYDTAWGWKVGDLLMEVKKKLGIDEEERLVAYITSYSACETLSVNDTLSFVEDQSKYRHVYVRKLLQWQTPTTDIPIMLANVICHSYYGNQTYRKSVAPNRLYYFPPQSTFKDVHDKIYSLHKNLYPVTNYEEEVINVPEKQQPFRLLTIPASRFSKCHYCKMKGCEGCVFPYDNQTTLHDISTDQNRKIQMEFYWRKKDKQMENLFEKVKGSEIEDENDKYNKKKSGTTIQDCFKLFEQPQILGQENAWYCPKCKDFVLAKKQMQIYKAPKILILCLKRFKRKEYYAQKYNIMVDFPLKDFDISKYVLNHNLPEEYFKGEKNDDSMKGSLIYDLIGITNHFGGTGGGHYTAYCEDPRTKKWFDFDDSCVDELKRPQDAITQSAYMLYYKRRE